MWIVILVMLIATEMEFAKSRKKRRTQAEKDDHACALFVLVFEGVFCWSMEMAADGKIWALWILALDIAIQTTILLYDSKLCRARQALEKEREMLKTLSASYLEHIRREKNEENPDGKVHDIWEAHRVAETRSKPSHRSDLSSGKDTQERERGEDRLSRSGRKKSA